MDNARLRPSLLHLQPLLQSVILLLIITVLLPLQVAASELTAQEERGRRIYFTGESPSGRPIVAYFGKDLLEVPGESATCASCHGFDGLGRSESGPNRHRRRRFRCTPAPRATTASGRSRSEMGRAARS